MWWVGTQVPLPPSVLLLGSGILGLVIWVENRQERRLNKVTGSNPAPLLLPGRYFYLGFALLEDT